MTILQMLERARENGDISLIGNELPMLERSVTKLGTNALWVVDVVLQRLKLFQVDHNVKLEWQNDDAVG